MKKSEQSQSSLISKKLYYHVPDIRKPGQAIKNNLEAIKKLKEANDHRTKTMEAM